MMMDDITRLSKTCATCAYSNAPKEGSVCGPGVTGICRKNPPIVVYGGDNRFYTEWPTVEEYDWCGDWQSR